MILMDCFLKSSVRRTSNHSQQRLLREEVLSLTQENAQNAAFFGVKANVSVMIRILTFSGGGCSPFKIFHVFFDKLPFYRGMDIDILKLS